MQRPRCSTNPPNTLRSSCAEGPGRIHRDSGHECPPSCLGREGVPGRAAPPQESRTISSTGSSTGSSGTGSPAMRRSSSSTACSPVSVNGTRSEVSERDQELGERHVVAADHRHVRGHLPPGRGQRAQHADRHRVAVREDRGDPRLPLAAAAGSRPPPPPGVQSALDRRSSPGSIPAARSASSYPCSRLRDTWRRNVPVTVPIAVWPRPDQVLGGQPGRPRGGWSRPAGRRRPARDAGSPRGRSGAAGRRPRCPPRAAALRR